MPVSEKTVQQVPHREVLWPQRGLAGRERNFCVTRRGVRPTEVFLEICLGTIFMLVCTAGGWTLWWACFSSVSRVTSSRSEDLLLPMSITIGASLAFPFIVTWTALIGIVLLYLFWDISRDFVSAVLMARSLRSPTSAG